VSLECRLIKARGVASRQYKTGQQVYVRYRKQRGSRNVRRKPMSRAEVVVVRMLSRSSRRPRGGGSRSIAVNRRYPQPKEKPVSSTRPHASCGAGYDRVAVRRLRSNVCVHRASTSAKRNGDGGRRYASRKHGSEREERRQSTRTSGTATSRKRASSAVCVRA